MTKCDCPNLKHTDSNGCILNHDGELGTVCQICYKLHQSDIQGISGVIQCRHRRIKIEDYHADSVDKYYCRVCKTYLPKDIADVALLTQIPTIKIWTGNRWSPDTCDCTVDLAFDDDTQKDEVYTFTTKGCPHHRNLRGQQFLDVMYDENGRKNGMEKIIVDTYPRLTKQIRSGKNTFSILADDIDFVFNFTGDDDQRVLHVEIQGDKTLTTLEKTQLKTLADTDFGTGRIVVE